jgi:hypothetical protein
LKVRNALPLLRFGATAFATLRLEGLEATPGIEPGYTVLQTVA